MKLTTQDYLKKALLDTQERVRDFMNYSDQIKEPELQTFFRSYAETEGRQAQELQRFINDRVQ